VEDGSGQLTSSLQRSSKTDRPDRGSLVAEPETIRLRGLTPFMNAPIASAAMKIGMMAAIRTTWDSAQ
jgi:hypothetical protein